MRISRSARACSAGLGAARRSIGVPRPRAIRTARLNARRGLKDCRIELMIRVGFIGLGEQGKPLAVNVAQGGFDLMVHDLRPEPVDELVSKGAGAARPAVVVGGAGVRAGARPGSTIAINSTVRPATVRKIGGQAAARGVGVLDAPVSGGPRGAQKRTMCYMVGGEKDALERCRRVFATSAGTIVHMGALGAGMTAKLAHQVILCLNMLAAHEGTQLARRAGLDAAALGEAVRA